MAAPAPSHPCWHNTTAPSTAPRLCHPDGCPMSLPKEQVSCPPPSPCAPMAKPEVPGVAAGPQNPAAKGDPTAPVPQVHTQLGGRAACLGFLGTRGLPAAVVPAPTWGFQLKKIALGSAKAAFLCFLPTPAVASSRSGAVCSSPQTPEKQTATATSPEPGSNEPKLGKPQLSQCQKDLVR